MKQTSVALLIVISLFFPGLQQQTHACTSVLVSRGASADGSVMTSWTYDVTGFMAPLYFYPGGEYSEGDSLRLYSFREYKYIGSISQVRRTLKVVGNMNELQVSIGETTFTGRKELHGGNGLFDYGNLIYVTLQRATSARDAIRIMDALVKEYGYSDTGEIFSIADKHEAWILEFIGKGEHGKGAVWVAARVPDGYIAAHANQARIRHINWKDTKNWMWSHDVVDFARQMGWFDGADKDFSFTDAYAPPTPRSLLLCESRVWSVFNRSAPSANLSADYWRCVQGAEPYPLFVKPDRKITIRDMIALHRDHFHDTPYYTGTGVGAGPYSNPYRWRPVIFKLDGDTTEYSWERPISQPQTAFSFITQARAGLPDAIGGIVWYSVDDNYSNVWMPFYLATSRVPPSLSGGSPVEFSWESMYWVFSLVNNYAYGLYNVVIGDIIEVQQEVENRAISMLPAIDKAAEHLYNTDRTLMEEYLTSYCVENAEQVTERWRQLAGFLFVKYNDRYKREEMRIDSWPKSIGYPDDFNRRAVEERPGYYEVRWRDKGEKID
jgi:dipeptidase